MSFTIIFLIYIYKYDMMLYMTEYIDIRNYFRYMQSRILLTSIVCVPESFVFPLLFPNNLDEIVLLFFLCILSFVSLIENISTSYF